MTFFLYVAIQLIAYAIDMGGFLALQHQQLLNAMYANAIGKIAAGCFAFIAHQNLTFRIEKKNRGAKQALRYIILLTINVPLSSAVLGIVLLFVNAPAVAKLISDVACVALTFLASKMWVFKSNAPQNTP